LNLLGMSYFFQNDYKTAKAKFERAIALNPSYAVAYANLGNSYFMNGQAEKAEEFLKKAIGISPNLVSAYYSLGAIYIGLGRADDAATYLGKGLELDPAYLDTHKSFIAVPSAQNAAEFHFAWARVFALRADVKKTVEFLENAKRAGFREWGRIESDKAFDLVRDNPEIRKYLKS
jgi:tetratricopeptide (TPR) repeat protein